MSAYNLTALWWPAWIIGRGVLNPPGIHIHGHVHFSSTEFMEFVQFSDYRKSPPTEPCHFLFVFSLRARRRRLSNSTT